MALATVLAVLLATNLLTNRLAPSLYFPTCVVAAAALLLIARRAGLGWADLGLGRSTVRSGLRWALVAFTIVLAAYAVLLAIPAGRTVLSDGRGAGLTVGALLWYALVQVPFATVLLEEVAFRGVLWALVRRRLGTAWATGVSSALFGLWHVLPSTGITRVNPSADAFGAGEAGQVAAVLAAVVGTAVAGVLLCELRRRSGSLLAPAGLHTATNSLGYLAAWIH